MLAKQYLGKAMLATTLLNRSTGGLVFICLSFLASVIYVKNMYTSMRIWPPTT